MVGKAEPEPMRTTLAGYLLPRLQDILFMAIFAGVIGIGPGLLNVDGDLGRHITIGKYILEQRKIPTEDIFSHTMTGEALTPHEWLAQVIYAGVHQAAGLDGVVWLCALLIATTFTLVFRQSYARSGMVLVALGWSILAAAAASLHWLARPHLFTLLLVALWVNGLERMRRGNGSRWWSLPLSMLLWANLHGAFIAGFVIWGAYLAGEAWERWGSGEWKRTSSRLLLAGGASFLATLINPSGWHLWETSLGYIRNRYLVSHTAEYLPPNFHEASTWPFAVMILLSLLILGRARERLPAAYALLLAGWTVMGLYSVRNVPIYAVVAAPVLASASAQAARGAGYLNGLRGLDGRLCLVEDRLKGKLWPALALLLAGMALAGGARLDFKAEGNRFDPAVFPVAAVDWLEAHPQPGKVFNYFPWGGYMLYRTWPAQQVFIDGQTDFYGEDLTRQYEQVITLSDGWPQVLQRYDTGWVLMPSNSSLASALEAQPSWHKVYQDETATILVRKR